MSLSELNVPPTAMGGIVTIGNFDGVHRGHQAMLGEVAKAAAAANVPAVVVTFDPHPVCILKPEVRLPRLSTIDTRISLLRLYGADEVIVLRATKDLLSMTAEQFFSEVVLRNLQAKGLVEGPNFHFGKDRRGNVEILGKLCEQHGLSLSVIDAVRSDDQMICSSQIRKLLADGNLDDAVDLLGHPYSICGTVGRGARRGRELGFPTANLVGLDSHFLLPADGVYSGFCVIDGHQYDTAVSIGPNPTFGQADSKIECHLIGFEGELYGASLSVDLVKWLRKQRTFSSKTELIEAIRTDISRCGSGE